MSAERHTTALYQVRKLLVGPARDGPTDAELLKRFTAERDEAAFELLVWRHAELVLGACRQVLRDAHAAEDAFQATFLVLFRKAGSVRAGEALAGWLHRVACRAALRARARGGRREVALGEGPSAGGAAPADWDALEALHEEVSHLPSYYRAVVVCCYLEGRTHEEAARVLGWSKGTVAGRLARAKELLRRRLTRRGVTLGAALGAVAWAAPAGWAARVGTLMAGLRGLAGGGGAAALSAEAVGLAQEVTQSMLWTKTQGAALALLTVALVGLGAALGMGGGKKGGGEGEGTPVAAQGPRGGARAAGPMEEAMRRAQVRRSLRTLALGMHNYHDTHNSLPAPAISDQAGKPLLSWRVAILPYIGQGDLYRQFKLNEAWDSPHNKKLLAKMPAVFAAVSPQAGKSTTNYQLIVGPTAVFTSHRAATGVSGGPGMAGVMGSGMGGPGGGRGVALPGGLGSGRAGGGTFGTGGGGLGGGMPGAGGGGERGPMFGGGPAGGGMSGGMPGPFRFTHISDGTSNTLLIVEAGRAVPWTKPEDVAYDPKKPVPALGGAFAGVFHAAFADGSVRSLSRRLDERVLRALITAAGGEVIDTSLLGPSGGPSSSPVRQALMRRLQERNEKLKDEAAVLRDILQELREEVTGLRWSVEADRLLELDPEAAALRKKNDQLEKAIRDGREEAKKLFAEVERLKRAVRRKAQED